MAAVIVTLDPAATVGGHLPSGKISYFISHPAQPSVFNREKDKKRHFGYSGGITARQAIVYALMQGLEEHYQAGKNLQLPCMRRYLRA